MKRKQCQFCGIKYTKVMENWLNHLYLGLICSDCKEGNHVKKLLNKYKG